jgi:hypothetical protein
MKRRKFIAVAAAGAAGVVLPAFGRANEPIARALAHPRLLEIFHGERIVRELGCRYREKIPGESDADALAHAIMAGNFASGSLPQLRAASLRRHVDEQVQRDFATGKTLTLDGWILSVTEARQCALFSLLPA